jgi:hypothetical protein
MMMWDPEEVTERRRMTTTQARRVLDFITEKNLRISKT